MAQATTWNASAQRTAFGQRSATTSAIQTAASALTWVISAAILAEGVEEAAQHGLIASRRGPDQLAGIVVDHDGQVPVPALVADLVDADPAQPGEPVHPGHRILRDRVTIAPTVRHATRISFITADFEAATANHAT